MSSHEVVPGASALGTALARFLKKYRVAESGCWEWTGKIAPNGYAHIWVKGRGVTNASRVSYELFRGPIADGLEVDHLCRNTRCVNPEHLEPVTRLENERRKLRVLQTVFRCGHAFEESNWYVLTNGKRYCRQCQPARCARRRAA